MCIHIIIYMAQVCALHDAADRLPAPTVPLAGRARVRASAGERC